MQADGQGTCCDGDEVRGRGGGLPVALAPTGSNLKQTAPNVFIRL